MQKPAKQFIDLLESQQLLAPDILDELRRQLAESKTRLTTELLAKLLVDNGHLTKFQATKLIAEIKDPLDSAPANQADQDDELGLAEDVTTNFPSKTNSSGRPSPVAAVFDDDDQELGDDNEDDVEIIEVADVEVEVVETPNAKPYTVPAQSMGLPDSDAFGSAPRVATRIVKPKKSEANPYDSFRILGVGILLALILVAGFFLVNFFWRGNAEEKLKRADDAYEQRSYETAATMYKEFAEVFPANAKASYAKVRSALAAIRKDAEGAPDPKLGLATALTVLPSVVGEPGLVDQQSDLAGALIALAGKFNERADRTQANAERKTLMEDMDKLLALIYDPQYVGANQRSQQEPTLNRIKEDGERIRREINRDEDLTTTLGEIDKRLSAEDALGVYALRMELINRYPLLEADTNLIQRVQRASTIQRSLVKSASLNAKLSKQGPPQPIGRSFVLANRSGDKAAALAGKVLFVKAKGSVYGIDGGTGEVLWRQFVGRQFSGEPLRLSDTSDSDAVICNSELGHISRVAGKSGEIRWFAELGLPVHSPVIESQDLFVASFSGTLASLDAASGQTKWATELPQPVSVPPGVAFNKPNLYVPAEHSNLYVVSRSDGSCQEVFYLGHRAGAIAVPPILLLGQLFVFENVTSQTCKIRILSTSDRGLELGDAQPPITLDGNVVVAPQIDGRRLIVQTDLGQIKVLDIEPTAETKKVSELVALPKNVFEPKQSWLIADSNKIWVADSRFTRYDLQVATQKLTRAWALLDGDRFVGPPQRFDSVIVHTRTLRGNQGVRVSAVAADSGKAYWETDLGIPVILVNASGAGYDAVNSSGMLYALGNTPIRSNADVNAGQSNPAMWFSSPVFLSDRTAVLLNNSRANQIGVYSTQPPKLRLLSANIGAAVPASGAVAVGTNIVLGLNSGQVVLLDLKTGSMAASPYQPPMEAGKKVRWNTPVYIEDAQTLIIASDLLKLVRLGVSSEMRVLSEVELENRLVGPLVLIGNQVCAVESTSGGDRLKVFDRMNLKSTGQIELPGRLTAGPFAVGEGCLIQTDGKLSLFSAEAKKVWEIDFPKSAILAAPTKTGDQLVLATLAGGVWVVDPATGNVAGNLDAGQPLTSAPIVLPAGLLVGSDEGAVLALPIPTTKSETP